MDFNFNFLTSNRSGNSVETAGSLAAKDVETVGSLASGQPETVGSLACLTSGDGVDSFGGKDAFGSIDFSNMNAAFFSDSSSSSVDSSASASVGADFGAGAAASSGASSGSFCSVC